MKKNKIFFMQYYFYNAKFTGISGFLCRKLQKAFIDILFVY